MPQELHRLGARQDAASQGYQVFMLVFCVVALLLLAVERALPMPDGFRHLIQYADFLICVVFFADFVYCLATARDRWRYLRTWGWIDLLSSIPAVDALRVGRGARILRIVRVMRGVKATRVIAAALVERRTQSALMAATLLFVLVLFAGSVGMLHFEHAEPGANITTPEDAAWWSFVTVTTVGYGDRVPVSSEGRVVAVLLMISGVLLLGRSPASPPRGSWLPRRGKTAARSKPWRRKWPACAKRSSVNARTPSRYEPQRPAGLPSAEPCRPYGGGHPPEGVRHNRKMFAIGKRSERGDAWADQGRMARTAALLRGGAGLVPRGVYRFSSFEEADAWMTKTMIAAQERRSPPTSSASAGR